MPDQIHLLGMGLLPNCDQLLAARYFRAQLNPILQALGARFQEQGFGHVLGEDEGESTTFEDVFEHIARNPESAGLVQENDHRQYPYTGCLMPGYPELKIWADDYWDRSWRIHAYE